MWCSGQLLAGLACVAVFSGLTNGWNLKVGGLVLVRIEDNYPSPDSPMHVANSEFMLVGGILFLGICIGALVNGPIVEQLGTRTTSIIGEVTSIILGTAIGVLASNEHWLIIWRLVGGIGMGICITSKPLYIVELSPKLYAGRLLAVLATSITLSMILAEASDMLIPHALAWIDVWRLLIALGMVFPTLLALFLFVTSLSACRTRPRTFLRRARQPPKSSPSHARPERAAPLLPLVPLVQPLVWKRPTWRPARTSHAPSPRSSRRS